MLAGRRLNLNRKVSCGKLLRQPLAFSQYDIQINQFASVRVGVSKWLVKFVYYWPL